MYCLNFILIVLHDGGTVRHKTEIYFFTWVIETEKATTITFSSSEMRFYLSTSELLMWSLFVVFCETSIKPHKPQINFCDGNAMCLGDNRSLTSYIFKTKVDFIKIHCSPRNLKEISTSHLWWFIHRHNLTNILLVIDSACQIGYM